MKKNLSSMRRRGSRSYARSTGLLYRLAGWMNQESLSLLSSSAGLAYRTPRLYEGLQQSILERTLAYEAALNSLTRALELRDRETETHTRRVVELSARLARHVGLPDHEIADLKRGAQLHDIGKLCIPDAILLKPDKLTPEEWTIMRRHTEYAVEILEPMQHLKGAIDVPHYHHERWDGAGYPAGLRGEAIPLPARIFSIVDVWDALISDRPYRRAWSKNQAVQYIMGQSGKHFDPRLLNAFLELIQAEAFEPTPQRALAYA